MAVQTSLIGKVVIEASTVGNLIDGTLDVTIGEGDTSAVGEAWTDVVALAKSWSLSFRVNHDKAGTAIAALRTEWVSGDRVLSAVQMWVDGSSYFVGTQGLVTGYSLTKSVGAVDQVSITLRGKTALSYTA